MRGLIGAMGLLTRVPVGGLARSGDVGLSAPWFPVVGAVVGGVVVVGERLGLNGVISATMAVTISLLLTGALHEDGLADTFDGLGSGREGIRRSRS